MKRLSIIVPMYNVEPYVERCLRSLQDQDVPKDSYEIICINDGSPDDSRGVVLRLQEEFENIILIDQENMGVSMARNKGINKASGKYVLMIDPDDYVVPGIFSSALNYAEKHDAEVSFLGYRFLQQDGTIWREILNERERGKIFSGIIASRLSRGDGKVDPDRMVAVLFNLDFLNKNNFRYLSDVPYLEDGELIARILCEANKCVFLGRQFYIRTTRENSATRSNLFHTKRATDGFIRSAMNLKNYRESKAFSKEQTGYLNTKIIKFITLSVNSIIRLNRIHHIYYIKRQLNNNKIKNVDLNGVYKSYYTFGERLNKSIESLLFFLIARRISAKFENFFRRK